GAAGAEAAAERAASAVAAGRPVPDVGGARAGEVQLLADQSVTTAGGQWGTTNYAGVSNLHSGGAVIDLWFKAGSPIISKQIRLVQTVTGSYQSVEAGPMVPDPDDDHGGALELGPDSRDPGRAIDQDRAGKGHSLPFTNPEYAVEYGPGGGVSTDLGDATAAGAGTNGSRDGTSEPVPATLHDKPIRSYAVDGQLWRQTFEVTALVVEGPFSGLYLGSVTWGWKNAWDKDEHGQPCNPTVQLLPTPIAVVREGSPSSAFMEAAERWNAQKFTDSSTGAEYDTVDLPLEVDPVVLPTLEVANLLAAARRAGTQDERQQFRAGLLERELRKRNVAIRVAVAKTGDLIGPDNVYARVAGVRTPVQRLGAGETHDFLLSLSKFGALPFTDPVQVDVLDEDTFGDDDLVAGLVWNAPFDYATATGTGGDAEYTVTVNYA
ncbi:hypothetical protein OM076_40190, partial [Solirubrobacter ginsenosidimutans]